MQFVNMQCSKCWGGLEVVQHCSTKLILGSAQQASSRRCSDARYCKALQSESARTRPKLRVTLLIYQQHGRSQFTIAVWAVDCFRQHEKPEQDAIR